MKEFIAENIRDLTFSKETYFERCNLWNCTFEVPCHFDRCNIIECFKTENCEVTKSNIIEKETSMEHFAEEDSTELDNHELD